jgi:hypothetical protein
MQEQVINEAKSFVGMFAFIGFMHYGGRIVMWHGKVNFKMKMAT